MWVAERHRLILELLGSHQGLTTERFADMLGVSRETVRRDLIELEKAGQLARVHGGAVAAASPDQPEPAYAERTRLRREQKREIGALAAALPQPGDACLLDAGSTTLALAEALALRPGITVITNSLEAARVLGSRAGHDVRLLGGRLDQDVPATYGDEAIAEVSRLHVEWAFVSPVSFSAEGGAMDYVWHEAAMARAMLGRAARRVLLADASKLGQTSRIQVCAAADVDVLVTDHGAATTLLEAMRLAGVRTVLPDAPLSAADAAAH
jgi:DeoR/GlpR family transcriptional regulator of sugar metabolism